MRFTVMGSGTSFGVPVVGCDCNVCTSADPRDRRTRVSAVFEAAPGSPAILVDTPPELRLQLLANGISNIGAVLYTHDHADHVHGIDDLRAASVRRKDDLPVYGPADSLDRIAARFSYIFDDDVQPPAGTSKPRLRLHPVAAGDSFAVAGLHVTPLECSHGFSAVFGYRVGSVAYLTDVKSIPDSSLAALTGLEVLVLNGLFQREHPTHLSIPEACEIALGLGAARTYLTHLTHESSHQELLDRLPSGVEPAFDGLSVQL